MNIPNVNEAKSNISYLFKHFFYVADANIHKNELHRLVKTQAVLFKFYEHIGSYIYLTKGTCVPEIANKKFVDIGTLSVTARAAFETLLAFYYLNIMPENNDEFEFIFDCLVMSGLYERIQATKTFTNEFILKNKEKIQAEEDDLNKHRLIIQSNPIFLSLKAGEKGDILKNGKWRIKGWKEIALKLGIDAEQFETLYGYLCSQAHTGGNSFIQMRSSIVDKETARDSSLLDILILGTLSFMIESLTKMSPYSKAEHESNGKAVDYVKFYVSFLGESGSKKLFDSD